MVRLADLPGLTDAVSYFWSLVDKTDDPDACWEWQGARNRQRGYGLFALRGGRTWGAHRLALLLTIGELPDDALVCHHCDNPPCCNPAHLYAGTVADNNRDTVRRGRRNPRLDEQHPHAKLTNAEVAELRACYQRGESASAVGRAFGVNPKTVRRYVDGLSRAHLFEPLPHDDRRIKYGMANYNAKLTDHDIRTIRQAWANRECTQRELARRYDVSKDTIWGIIHLKTWRHIS